MDVDKKFVFFCGLPRTGQTALGNIFAQNNDIYFSGHSPLVALLHGVSQTTEIHARENLIMMNKYDGFRTKAMKSMIDLYYGDRSEPIIIDKGRTWACEPNRNYASDAFDLDTKYIVFVRPIDEIIKSFASLRIKNDWKGDIFSDLLAENSDPILWPLNGIFYSKFMSLKNTMFVTFEDVICDTRSVISKICEFTQIPKFVYSLKKIEETVCHNDNFIGLNGLHDVRASMSKRNHDVILPDHILTKCLEYNQRMIDMGINLGRTFEETRWRILQN